VASLARHVDVPSPRVRSLIDDVVVEMSTRLDASATAVTDSIHAACEGLSESLYSATRQSTRANLGLVTTLIADGAEPKAIAAPQEAVSYARAYVRDGLSFELLTRVYREGEHAYARLWLEQLQARASEADELADAMGYFSDWLFGYIGAVNQELSVVYTAEHERWIRGAAAMRSEEVRAILSGRQVNVTQASSRLRYRLDGPHLGFVIWSDEREAVKPEVSIGGGFFAEMERLAAEVADSVSATSALLLPIGSDYAGWASVRPDVDITALPQHRDGLRVALGSVRRGVDGFRRTYQEALLARRVASMSERPSTSGVSFGNVALDALLTHDVDEARRFVHDEIGPLMGDSDANRRLLATLEIFLHEESSFVRAARRLGIHENTVAYRVHRAEELLGRRSAERQLELRAALRLAHFVRGENR